MRIDSVPRALGPFVVWRCPVRLRFPVMWFPPAQYLAAPFALALLVPGGMLLAGVGGWTVARLALGVVLVALGARQAVHSALALWGRCEITIDRVRITFTRRLFRWRRATTIDARELVAAIVRRGWRGAWLEVRVRDGEHSRSVRVARGAYLPVGVLIHLADLLRSVRDGARVPTPVAVHVVPWRDERTMRGDERVPTIRVASSRARRAR